MKIQTAGIVIAATLLVSGCGGTPTEDAAPTQETVQSTQPASGTPTSVSPSLSEEVSRSATAEPSEGPSSVSTTPDASASPSTTPSQTSSITETPSTVPTAKAGATLGLADFFEPDSAWEENRYEVADQANVSGIAIEVSTSSETSAHELELRLANTFDTLNFTVGQANDSESSARVMVVQVLGNNKQLDVQSVPFNTIQPVSVPVAGVNAVVIRLYLESSGKSGSVNAVISDISVE